MLAALYTPPDMPAGLGWLVFGAIALAGILTGAWRGFLWLIGRIQYVFGEELKSDRFKAFMDERLETALESRAFKGIVDERVAAAFSGATAPLMKADREIAGDVAKADGKAEAAHDRIDTLERRFDDHLEHHT